MLKLLSTDDNDKTCNNSQTQSTSDGEAEKDLSEDKTSNDFPIEKNKFLTVGYCIRCGKIINYNPQKPLCWEHHRTWSKYNDANYEEKFCHNCGKRVDNISFKHCFCEDCKTEYQKETN